MKHVGMTGTASSYGFILFIPRSALAAFVFFVPSYLFLFFPVSSSILGMLFLLLVLLIIVFPRFFPLRICSVLSCPPFFHFYLPVLPPPFVPSLLSPAVHLPSSCSSLHFFTRAALPTIRTHYCQLCHLRPPERQRKRRDRASGGGMGVYVVTRWVFLQLSGYCHKEQCLITNKHWFNQGSECYRIDCNCLLCGAGALVCRSRVFVCLFVSSGSLVVHYCFENTSSCGNDWEMCVSVCVRAHVHTCIFGQVLAQSELDALCEAWVKAVCSLVLCKNEEMSVRRFSPEPKPIHNHSTLERGLIPQPALMMTGLSLLHTRTHTCTDW